jgi:hypothetical protein
MKNYNREVRPVVNASTPVVVHVGITLTQIFDMVNKMDTKTNRRRKDTRTNEKKGQTKRRINR